MPLKILGPIRYVLNDIRRTKESHINRSQGVTCATHPSQIYEADAVLRLRKGVHLPVNKK